MNEEILQQIFAELFSALEPLETRIAALLQLLKSKGIVTDEELAPFLEQAGNTSSVRWRAARVRTAALISSAMKPADEHGQAATAQADQSTTKPASETGPASETNIPYKTDGKGREAKSDEVQKPEKPAEVKANAESREEASSRKTEEPEPKAAYSDEDLRSSKLSDPPLLKTGRDKDKGGKSADPAASEQSPPEAESKPKAA